MKRLLLAIAIAASGAAFAESFPVMGSLFTPVQAPDAGYDVKGLRLSLVYGECQEFCGLDIGIANRTRKDFSGLAIGGGNIVDGKLYGGQVGLVNWNGNKSSSWADKSIGGQLGLFNCAYDFCGFQDGFVNVAKNRFCGWQYSFFNFAKEVDGLQCGFWAIIGVNVAEGALNGCQIGIVDYTRTLNGCQIGILNYAAKIESGVQIGIVNVIDQGGFAPVMPIINGKF